MSEVNIRPNRLSKADREDATFAFASALECLGLDLSTEHLADTPRRIVGMYEELFFDEPWNLTTFKNTGDSGIVIVRDISFRSLCAHHFALFTGVAHVAYIPGEKLVGLSKLARTIESFSKGPNVQELIGRNAADFLVEHLEPVGVAVIIVAEHTCMSERGVKAHGSSTVTSSLRGVFDTDATARAELMSLLRV